MAPPVGRLMTLLAKQSPEANKAILSHLAPAVAKGSVRINRPWNVYASKSAHIVLCMKKISSPHGNIPDLIPDL